MIEACEKKGSVILRNQPPHVLPFPFRALRPAVSTANPSHSTHQVLFLHLAGKDKEVDRLTNFAPHSFRPSLGMELAGWWLTAHGMAFIGRGYK